MLKGSVNVFFSSHQPQIKCLTAGGRSSVNSTQAELMFTPSFGHKILWAKPATSKPRLLP